MERSNLIEMLEQLLESEERSEHLTKLPSDIYTRIAIYTQKLRKGAGVEEDDVHARIARRQLQLIEGMVKQLVGRRLAKSAEIQDTRDLLPEERFVRDSYSKSRLTQDRFTEALVNGQPSFFAILQKQQMQKMVTVRFTKPLAEVMGFDLNRYGPFKEHDIARIPAGNADALISSGDALEVYTKDS